MAYTVDNLEIKISAESATAAQNIRALADALGTLKNSISEGTVKGLKSLSERITELKTASTGTSTAVKNIRSLGDALSTLKGKSISKTLAERLPSINVSATAPQNISNLAKSVDTLKNSMKGSSNGMKTLAERLDVLGKAANRNSQPIAYLVRFLNAMERTKGVNIPKSMPERLSAIGKAADELSEEGIKRIDELTRALERLRGVNLTGFSAAMKQAKQAANDASEPIEEEAQRVESQTYEVNVDDNQVTSAEGKIRDLMRQIRALRARAVFIHADASKVDSAKAKLKELYAQLKDARSGKIYLDSDTINEASKKIKDLRNELKQVSKTHKVGIDTGRLGKLVSSIQRVAFYRAIRTLIKGITDSFKVGIENLYQYSLIAKTSFAPAMDRAASSLLYLKNSLGSMAGPLLESLIPVLETVVDHVAALADWLAQLFAALNGQSTYSRAIKTTTQFAKATDKAAKSMQRYLAPFDELNVITDPNKSGSGKTSADYSKMFEEAAVAGNIMEIAEKIKPILDWIGQHVGEIAAGLAAWKIGSGLLSKLGLVEGSLKRIAGVGAIAIGITLVWSTINDIKKGLYKNASWQALWKELLGGALFGGGLAAILGVGLGAGALMVTIGAVLAVAISDIIINWDHIKGIYQKGSKGDFAGALLEYMEGDSWTTSLQKAIIDGLLGEGAWEQAKKNLKQYGNEAFLLPFKIEFSVVDKETGETVKRETVGQWLTRKLADLFGGKVVPKEAQPAGIGGNVNTSFFNLPPNLLGNGPDVSGIFSGFTKAQDEVKANTEKNWGFIGKFIPQTVSEIQDAVQNPIAFIVKKITGANKESSDNTNTAWGGIKNTLTTVWNYLSSNNALSPWDLITSKISEKTRSVKAFIEEKWSNAKDKVKSIWDFLASNNALSPWGAIGTFVSEKTAKVKDFLTEQWGIAKDRVKSAWDFLSSKEGMSPWSAIVTGVSKNTENAIKAVTDKWENLKTTLSKLWEDIKTGVVDAFEGIKNAIKTPINAIINFVETVANGFVEAINTAIRGLNTINVKIPDWIPGVGGEKFGFDIKELQKVNIQRLATGGFPEDGLFFANHNELVGKFSNGRTAVVNNEQIEGGITNAVENGNVNLVAALLNVADRIVQAIDEKDTSTYIDGRAISASQTRYARAYGR